MTGRSAAEARARRCRTTGAGDSTAARIEKAVTAASTAHRRRRANDEQPDDRAHSTCRITSAASLPPNASDVDRPQRTSALTRLVGHDVERAFGIALAMVDGRRDHAAGDRQGQDGGLDGTGGAETVAGHRLDRVDGHRRGAIAEHAMKRARLGAVVVHRARAVRVDVIDGVGRKARVGERRPNGRGDDRARLAPGDVGWYASHAAP